LRVTRYAPDPRGKWLITLAEVEKIPKTLSLREAARADGSQDAFRHLRSLQRGHCVGAAPDQQVHRLLARLRAEKPGGAQQNSGPEYCSQLVEALKEVDRKPNPDV
jgi:hypothetical protein